MPSKNVAFIEGESKAQDIIFDLADKIAAATWKDIDGITPIVNKWSKVFTAQYAAWVTYREQFRNQTGKYKHTDGNLYTVYQMGDASQDSHKDAQGFVASVKVITKKIQVGDVTYKDALNADVTIPAAGMMLALIPTLADPTVFTTLVVEQKRKELDNTFKADPNWNEFQFLGTLNASAGDYAFACQSGIYTIVTTVDSSTVYSGNIAPVVYAFSERYYTADPVHFFEPTVVLKAIPDVPNGTTSFNYFVMFKMPKLQFNYFDVYYGTGFAGTAASGDPASSYNLACDVATVLPNAVPTIINQKQAEAAYLRAKSGTYVAPSEAWDKDIDGETDIKSPSAHYHFGANSVIPWLVDKKRRPDYLVAYAISVNNDRAAIMLEGDPSPDIDGYYRSFAYIGKIIPFNDYDQGGNFAATVGMGDLEDAKTGMLLSNIKQDTNPLYSGFGRYTSNGMYSVSMLRTRSSVLFQAYYPAFVTQLPNYSAVGTLPPELSRLILEKHGFQPSTWTDKYHASPIYLVHQVEGYRGYMEGLVAINDYNLVNEDELVVDTEEWKDAADHSKGTWTEVYKFYSLKSPVNFFKSSANPDGMAVAILKEVK